MARDPKRCATSRCTSAGASAVRSSSGISPPRSCRSIRRCALRSSASSTVYERDAGAARADAWRTCPRACARWSGSSPRSSRWRRTACRSRTSRKCAPSSPRGCRNAARPPRAAYRMRRPRAWTLLPPAAVCALLTAWIVLVGRQRAGGECLGADLRAGESHRLHRRARLPAAPARAAPPHRHRGRHRGQPQRLDRPGRRAPRRHAAPGADPALRDHRLGLQSRRSAR